MTSEKKPTVILLCSGLGRIQRGYESFTRECFDTLSEMNAFNVRLIKGAGESSKNEKNVPSLFRRASGTKKIAAILRRSPYYLEQVSFAISALPTIIRDRPDVLFVSDGTLANTLWHLRRLLGLKYKILFSNGGPLNKDLSRWDHVQQLVPAHLKDAEAHGVKKQRQTLLPYGLKIEREFSSLTVTEIKELRERLGLPSKRKIILSVGTINMHHKRMDYLVREVARLEEPRPFLLMLGQREFESAEVERMAFELLSPENVSIRTIPADIIDSYYRVADIFTLASLSEGLARAFLEAYSWGLPCIAHNYEVPRFVFADDAYFVDMTKDGELAAMLKTLIKEGDSLNTPEGRHEIAYQRFSWDNLAPQYIDMINKLLSSDA